MKKQFYLFPGVFKVEGKEADAYLNIASGEIFCTDKIGPDESVNEKLFSDLEQNNLGLLLAKNQHFTEIPNQKINFVIEENVKLMILENIESLKYIDIPIRSIDYFFQEGPVQEEEIRKVLLSYGHNETLTFYKFDSQVCPNSCFNAEPTISPYFYYFNSKYNPCWGLSVAIDKNGDVKPCLWHDTVIGNINTLPFKEIKEKLIKYWQMTKDNIETCMDCELRYACSDCRVSAAKMGGHITSKTAFCNYNKK